VEELEVIGLESEDENRIKSDQAVEQSRRMTRLAELSCRWENESSNSGCGYLTLALALDFDEQLWLCILWGITNFL